MKEKVKNVEGNKRRNFHIIDTLTPVDSCENPKRGGKMNEIYEGIIYREREKVKISPFRKVIEKLFTLK